jgi:hypothetical protein
VVDHLGGAVKGGITMKTLLTNSIALGLLVVATTGCDDDKGNTTCGAGTMLVGSTCEPVEIDAGTPPGAVFHQIEHLARPGINEVFLFTSAFAGGYNATAPSFTGVDAATLGLVVGEAKTVLKALYLGPCLLNGLAGLDANSGLHPAGFTCTDVGAAVFEADGVTIKASSATQAQAYADRVFGQFEPDVMRIDTAVTSSYLTLCGGASDSPLLCGGRFLTDDTIDITYDYLLAGAAVNAASPLQFRALVGDGVSYSTNQADGANSVSVPDPNNRNQFHPAVSNAFPYSAAPF